MNELIILKPAVINGLEVRNRVFMAPMTRCRADNPELSPTELHMKYYAQRASAGLIITEGTIVSSRGTGFQHVPGIFSKTQVEAWKKVTGAVHENGGKIFVQLWHVGRLSHPFLLGGKLPVAPSAINPDITLHTPSGKVHSVTPQELSKAEIKKIVVDFANAGKNAIAAGFDGVEIHSSNGYLFHQFFSNSSNIRTDEYGGSDENKSRILFEVIEALSRVMPAAKIGVRLNPMLHGRSGIVVDGQTGKTFEHIIKNLNQYHIAYIHLSRPPGRLNEPYYIEDVIGHFGKLFSGFTIANGNYDLKSANLEVETARADAVAFARSYIANPDLVDRFRNNWVLAEADASLYYTQGPKGYTDYASFHK